MRNRLNTACEMSSFYEARGKATELLNDENIFEFKNLVEQVRKEHWFNQLDKIHDRSQFFFHCLSLAAELGLDDAIECLIKLKLNFKEFDLLSVLDNVIRSGSVDAARLVLGIMRDIEELHPSHTHGQLPKIAEMSDIPMLNLLTNEFGLNFSDVSELTTSVFLSRLIHSYSEHLISNPASFLKHALKSSGLRLNNQAGREALERAMDCLDAKMARILLAHGAPMYHEFDKRKMWDRNTHCTAPHIDKLADKIGWYLNTAEETRKLKCLLPVTIRELDGLIRPTGHGYGDENDRFIFYIESHVDFILDYIEAQLLRQSQKMIIDDNYQENDLLDNIIKLTAFYYIRKGKPEVILSIFDAKPESVNIKDKDGYSILSVLLSPYTGWETAPKITLKSASKLINALYRHGYDFDATDASGKNAWQLLEEHKLLGQLRTSNPICMMRFLIDLIVVGSTKNAEKILIDLIKKDLSFVSKFIENLTEAASFEASFSETQGNQTEEPEEDHFNNYSYLPSLIILYQKCLKSSFGNTMMNLVAYNIQNSAIPPQKAVFRSKADKIEFIKQFKAELPISEAWLESEDFKEKPSQDTGVAERVSPFSFFAGIQGSHPNIPHREVIDKKK